MDGEPWDPKSSLGDPMKLKGCIASCVVSLKPRLGQSLHTENRNNYARERERESGAPIGFENDSTGPQRWPKDAE